jgi:type I restriction enzyme R subunit
VLFASNVIDYDYIMELISQSSHNPQKQKETINELIEKIKADAKFIDDCDDIEEYIQSLNLQSGNTGLTVEQVKQGYIDFKHQKNNNELFEIATKHNLDFTNMQNFVDFIIKRMIFDNEQLRNLLAPLELGWKDRSKKELELVKDLLPLLRRRAGNREISGLKAYE